MAKTEAGERWAKTLVRKVGLAMKKARGNKSARWLSDETAALGYRVSPTVIAKLDSGHRGSVLSVAELLVLAAALDIPPGLLLFPGYPEGEIEFLPGRTARAHRALDWFAGPGGIPGPDGEPHAAPPNAGTELIRLARQWEQVGRTYLYLEERSRTADTAADRRLLDQQLRRVTAEGAELQARIDRLTPTFAIEEKPR